MDAGLCCSSATNVWWENHARGGEGYAQLEYGYANTVWRKLRLGIAPVAESSDTSIVAIWSLFFNKLGRLDGGPHGVARAVGPV